MKRKAKFKVGQVVWDKQYKNLVRVVQSACTVQGYPYVAIKNGGSIYTMHCNNLRPLTKREAGR